MIDLSKYDNIFMSKINEHGDREKLHNLGIVKINKEDISIAYVGVSRSEGEDDNSPVWVVKTYHYEICFKMKCGMNISIPLEWIDAKDPNFENKKNDVKATLHKELNELLGG